MISSLRLRLRLRPQALALLCLAACTQASPSLQGGEEAVASPREVALPREVAALPRDVAPAAPSPARHREAPPVQQVPDEVPAFLLDPAPAPDAPDASDDSLEAWMGQVQVGGEGEAGSFASIQIHPLADPPPLQEAPVPDTPSPPDNAHATADAAHHAREAAVDPCADLERLLEERQAYLARVAAERDAFGWIDDPADAEALRLLQGLRRCEEFPDDPDCKAPPIERDLRDLEPPRHQFERWPTELVVEPDAEDRLVHDPTSLDLLHRLKACRRAATPQPLLR